MSQAIEKRTETVELGNDKFEVDFSVFNDEQIHIKEILVNERVMTSYLSQEVKDEIEGYLMHHFTNHSA